MEKSPHSFPSGLRALVADDHDLIRKSIAKVLVRLGFSEVLENIVELLVSEVRSIYVSLPSRILSNLIRKDNGVLVDISFVWFNKPAHITCIIILQIRTSKHEVLVDKQEG